MQRSPSSLRKRRLVSCPTPFRVQRPYRCSKPGEKMQACWERYISFILLSIVESYLELFLGGWGNINKFVCSKQLEAPLHLAVKNGHIPVIHSLVAAGCNINVADKVESTSHRQTAAHYVARSQTFPH